MKVILDDGSEFDLPNGDAVARAIARNLGTDYPGTTDADVRAELGKPKSERGIIGMFAYGMLEQNHLIPEKP